MKPKAALKSAKRKLRTMQSRPSPALHWGREASGARAPPRGLGARAAPAAGRTADAHPVAAPPPPAPPWGREASAACAPMRALVTYSAPTAGGGDTGRPTP